MKKRLVLILTAGMCLLLLMTVKGIARGLGQGHLADSEDLIKSSSFERYTLAIFQEEEGVRVELYSSYPWFEDKKAIVSLPVTPTKAEVSIFWKSLELERNGQPVGVVMLYAEADVDDAVYGLYDAYLVNSDDFDLDGFFNLQEIDIKENPSKID